MSDTVVIAAIAAIPPVLVTLLTYLAARKKVKEVHDVVNSKHEAALLKITKLETEVRRLQEAGTTTPETGTDHPVTITESGQVDVSPPKEEL